MADVRSQKLFPEIVASRAEVPAQDVEIDEAMVGIMCSTGGAAELIFRCETSSVVVEMVAGVIYPWDIKEIVSAGTTAAGFVALRW